MDTMAPSFDAARCVTFDLARGHVELSDGEPHVLVPVDALIALLRGKSDARALGRAIGTSAIVRAGMQLGRGDGRPLRDRLRDESLETIVELLGGELAVVGLGSLRIERWGAALLFVFDPCSLQAAEGKEPYDLRAAGGEAGWGRTGVAPEEGLLCGVVEGALGGLTDRTVHAVVVDRSDALRVLVVNANAAARAESLLKTGVFFTDIVSMLHEAGAL